MYLMVKKYVKAATRGRLYIAAVYAIIVQAGCRYIYDHILSGRQDDRYETRLQ